jgi:radical SAM superfamily enzyme YgiQ (UPF0313 family)
MKSRKQRIGFIAMSGVRADNPEVARAGLTFPGVLERGRVIASLPSLSLLTLAGLTPPNFEVEYHEVRDLSEGENLPQHFDLIAISTLSAQAFDAYTIARRFRGQGIPVIMGGLHVTCCPDEALEHCTSVVIGEGEPLWPRVLDDLCCGRLQPRYESQPGDEFDLADSPLPRFDLLDLRKYNRLTVQTARGCPHDCEFCASSILLTKKYKRKPVANIIREIRAIRRLWSKPFIEFADDNSFVHRGHARELMAALRPERVQWFTEADISIANDPELLTMMRQSGCRQVLIGLESPRSSGLDGIERRSNWKLQQFDKYEAAIRTIQSHGITVNACFILGLDADGEDVFANVQDFVQRTTPYDVQITVLTPFPGTPLYARLLKAGRLIRPGAWNTCTLFDVNFVPARMSPQRLQWGLIELAAKLYHPDAVRARREQFFAQLDKRRIKAAMPRPWLLGKTA